MLNDATVIARSRNLFHAHWNEILRLRRTVLATWALEDIHDLRVASRRFRAAANLFEPFAAPKQVATLQKHVRKLTRALGGLRNIDEARAFFISSLTPETGGSENGVVAARLSHTRKREVAGVEKALKSFKAKKLDRVVRRIVAHWGEAASAGPFSAYLSNRSLALFQRVHDQLVAATAPENATARHTLRIAVKKWRYFLEIAAHILDRESEVELEHLKSYQSVLGRMNDMVEFSALCRELKLDPSTQLAVEDALRRENGLLWKRFMGLLKKQPLRYTFRP